jgi:hypothetical protein
LEKIGHYNGSREHKQYVQAKMPERYDYFEKIAKGVVEIIVIFVSGWKTLPTPPSDNSSSSTTTPKAIMLKT